MKRDKEIGAIILSITVGVVIAMALSPSFDGTRCADGWHSPSIGKQGACSHHGGVGYGDPTPWYVGPVAIGSGLLVLGALTWVFGLFQTPKVIDHNLLLFEQAIKEHRPVRFLYAKPGKEPEERTITPMEIILLNPKWPPSRCVAGRCHRANDERKFLLSRIYLPKLVDDTGQKNPSSHRTVRR